MIVGITPVRISLAGGGTDMPEYYEKYGGNVVSSTISLFTYLMIKLRKDNSFQAFSSDFAIHQSKTSYKKLKAKTGIERLPRYGQRKDSNNDSKIISTNNEIMAPTFIFIGLYR